MKTTAKKAKEKDQDLYDGGAAQRIPLELTEGDEIYATAHKVSPVTDAIFLEFIDEGDEAEFVYDKDDERSAEDQYTAFLRQRLDKAVEWLWRRVVRSIEKIEVEDGADFRDLIDHAEIDMVVTALMNAVVVRPETVSAGVRVLSPKATVTVKTQAFFNGKITTQTHTLLRKSDEHRKIYDQIFERKAKPSVRASAKGDLYDSLVTKTEGFQKDKVPLRFKVQVVDYLFEDSITLKK